MRAGASYAVVMHARPTRPVALLLAVAALSVAAARAQEPPSRGTLRIELAGGTDSTHPLAPNALRLEEQDVREASCRSCTGRHYVYDLDVRLEDGPVARVVIHADVVGRRRSFTTGPGPYPADSRVRVWLRDGGEVSLTGRIELDFAGSGARPNSLAFQSQRADAPVRAIRLELPRTP